MNNNPKFFVTHIIIPELPEEGFDQVFFYTATAQSYDKGKYYWGTDNNSFDQEYIDNLVKQKSIFRLEVNPYPMELNDNETLWIDNNGNLYVADLDEPTLRQRKLKQQPLLKNKIINSVYSSSVSKIVGWPPQISKATIIMRTNRHLLQST